MNEMLDVNEVLHTCYTTIENLEDEMGGYIDAPESAPPHIQKLHSWNDDGSAHTTKTVSEAIDYVSY